MNPFPILVRIVFVNEHRLTLAQRTILERIIILRCFNSFHQFNYLETSHVLRSKVHSLRTHFFT